MTGKSAQHAAAAYARWAALSPAERRAATVPGTAASAAARRAKAERRAAREAERRANDDRSIIGAVQPDTLAEARRIAGPCATDRELAAQCLLVIKARRSAGLADPTERGTDVRHHEEGRRAGKLDAQEVREDHHRVQGKA